MRAGEWTTYGDLSAAVHGHARAARRAARAAAVEEGFPNAHRVLRADGTIARPDDDAAERALARLTSEGVTFAGRRADPARRIHFDELQRRAGERAVGLSPPR